MLSDEEQKSLYDKYGKEGVERGSGGGGMSSGSDVFSQMFGGGGGRRQGPSGPRKGEDCVHAVQVNLQDCYVGGVRKLVIQRQTQADPNAKPSSCEKCRGRGVVMITRQLGPGLLCL